MKRAKLGGIEFTIISSENITDSASVTDNPVESGQDVSDHVKQNPSELSLTGIMVGGDESNKFMKLKEYKEDGKLLYYIGRESHPSMIITNIQRNYDVSNKDGFGFDLSLKQVRISSAKMVQIRVSAPKKAGKPKPSTGKSKKKAKKGTARKKVSTKVKKKTNKGKQQPRPKKVSPKVNKPKPNSTYSVVSRKDAVNVSSKNKGYSKVKRVVNVYKPKPKSIYSGTRR